MRSKYLVLILILLLALPVLAQDGMPPMPELTGDIIMDGLNGPQGLYLDTDGTLYVIDSGLGGEDIIPFIDPMTMEVIDAPFGFSSRILTMQMDSEPEVIAMLPSVAGGEDVLGGARVAIMDGTLYATVGSWQGNLGKDVSLDNFAAVVSVDENGELTDIGDFWTYELENNPDNTDNLESHPFGIIAGSDGLLYIADAASNALITLDPATGEMATAAVFEALPGVFPNPMRGGEMLTDPVPTAVVIDADGNTFVSLLSGAPFVPGSAKVVQVADDGAVSDFATGLTMLIDLKAAPDGNLYAVSFGMFSEEGPVFNSGSVIRILPDGSTETIISGLPFATAIAIDDAGNGYVAINGVPIPEAGMVVYYEGLTNMEALPEESMGG